MFLFGFTGVRGMPRDRFIKRGVQAPVACQIR